MTCDDLIFTDSAPLAIEPSFSSQSVFLCFDSETALEIEGVVTGAVRLPRDYGARIYGSFEELYAVFTCGGAPDDDPIDQNGDVEKLVQTQVQAKVCAIVTPILYVWEIAGAAVHQEMPRRISVCVRDPWLKTVLSSQVAHDQWTLRPLNCR